MKPAFPCLLFAALLLGSNPTAADAQDAVPVEIGGEAELDACAGVGRIAGLDPKGDNFLSVRGGPGTEHAERDRLGAGTSVTICDESGPWFGIVYPAAETDEDCGVSSPQERRLPYRGPCRSGWVHGRFVEMVAG